MRRRRYKHLGRRFTRGKHRQPVVPKRVPRPSELPSFEPEAGQGKFIHWTELDPKVKREIMSFVRKSLNFKKPVMETDYEVTGSVDAIVWDKGRAKHPCVAFEVKSAKPWIRDKWARGGKRAGRYQIDPAQHEERLSDSGKCPLYYVLAAVDEKKKQVDRVGICSLDMIEEIVESPLTEPRGIHYEAAYECPSSKEWPKIRWTKTQKKVEKELEDVPF